MGLEKGEWEGEGRKGRVREEGPETGGIEWRGRKGMGNGKRKGERENVKGKGKMVRERERETGRGIWKREEERGGRIGERDKKKGTGSGKEKGTCEEQG